MRPVRRALVVDVVLVELQLGCPGDAGHMARCGLHHALAGLIPDHRVQGVGALRCGVLRMRVVIVKARAVREHEVALDLGEGEVAMLVQLEVGRLVRILS